MLDLSPESFRLACREGGPRIDRWLRAVDRQYGASLYREAARALGNWQQAQDVVQEGMLRVWQRCASFAGTGDPIGWIRSIVRNAVIDELRRRAPEDPLLDDTGELSAVAAQAVVALSRAQRSGPEDLLAFAEVEAAFRAGFAAFTADHPVQARALRWVVEDGLTPLEVSELIGRSPGATREFISQCRRKARPYLAHWYALLAADADRR